MKPDAWSFVPPAHRNKFGEGPFRVRGTVYSGNVEYVEKRLPGGLSAVFTQIGIPDVERFFRDTIFLAASLYDIEPLMHFARAVARIEGIPIEKYIRRSSHFAALQDVAGKYRAQLRSATSEDMAARLPPIFGRYFEPCRAEVLSVEKDHSELRYSGLPASAIGLHIWACEGFVAGALEATGARDIRFAWTTPLPDGDVEGVPVQAVRCRITWKTTSP